MSSNFFTLSSSGPVGRVRDNGTVARLNGFMRSPLYIILLAALTMVSNFLSLELYLYTFFILISVFIALFGTDLLPLMPIVIFCYIAPSPANNPGSASNQGSIFLPQNGGIYLMILAGIFLVSLLFRMITDSELGGRAFLAKKRPLIGGMLLLSGSYLLSGLGMGEYGQLSWKILLFGLGIAALTYGLIVAHKALSHKQASLRHCLLDRRLLGFCLAAVLAVYGIAGGLFGLLGELPSKNLLFALIQCAAVLVLYYLFTGTVNWKQTPKAYLAWLGMCAGLVVVPQLLQNYFSGRIFMDGTGTIDRELIYTGWGMHNNMGGMMAFMLPFPFYLACTQKRSWIYSTLGTLLMLGVIISCSRTSMLVAAAVYAVCSVFLFRRKEERKANLLVYGIIAVGVIVTCAIFYRKLLEIFALFFEELFIMSERDNLVGYGLKQYLANPIFGGSFFPQGEYVPWDWSTSEAFSSFFPPRWHNTLIQMLASCGIVGFVCYVWHRYQTVKLILKERSTENLFIGLYLVSLVLCSLMDCHFFNVGPVLFYSMALAYAENIHQSEL